MTRRLLLLGGTAEASELAARLSERPCTDLTVSLAGRTARPAPVAGRMRTGGFGGAAGLADWLRRNGADALIDATHPFAARIAANAVEAAAMVGIPRLKLLRPAWALQPGWREAPSLEAALATLPPGAVVLATTGSLRTRALAMRPDCHIVLRAIEPPGPLPPHVTTIIGRPPFSLDDERQLLRTHGVTHLITRNAGGAHRARLDAAAEARAGIVLIARPPPPPGPVVSSVAEALASLDVIPG